MSFLINPFLGTAPAYGTVGPMALASRSATATINDTDPITFNNEVHDAEGVFAATSGIMTIPSDGIYRWGCGASLNTSGYFAAKAQVDGAAIHGGYGATCHTANPQWHSGWGAAQELSINDQVRMINQFGGATYGADGTNYTWLGLERLPSGLNRARVRKSANQTSFSSGTISFDTEDIDTLGFHDTVTNNERLTVPVDVTRIRLLANIVTGSFNGQAEVEIRKNGSAGVVGLPGLRASGTGNKLINLFGPPVNVSNGDYFDLYGQFESSNSILSEQYTWFSIEEVPAAIKSALVYHSTGHSLNTTDAYLNWDSEDHDPDGMHSTSSNTSRLTVPSGCTWARAHWFLKGQSGSTALIWAQVKKNAANVIGTGMDSRAGLAGQFQKLHGNSAWVAVTPGDYFELQARVGAGSITTTGGWFALECM